ncbi:MAG: hypothetical protein ACI9AT_000844 [Ulvibacter sp.]
MFISIFILKVLKLEIMKNNNRQEFGDFFASHLKVFLLLCCFILPGISLIAQEEEQPADKPVRATFNSALLIDNQSVMVPIKGTFEFDILHRFGTVGNGFEDLYGLYASSNMKLGFTYAPIDNLSVGLGLTKRKHMLDLNAKYALLKQMRSGKIPVSVTYFGNMAIDLREEDKREEVYHSSNRYSYFHQLIVARKFTPELSLQVAGSLSHFNIIQEGMDNDHYAISLGGKYKLTETLSGIFNVDQPITKHKANNPNPNLSLGLEVSTSSHAFQVFVGNYSSIVPQENNVFNANNYNPDEGEGSFGDNLLIGFNITRLWNW